MRILFGRDFKNLNIVTQKSYGGLDTGYHGARLDVYIEEGDEVEVDSTNVSAIYDIEPDKNNKKKDGVCYLYLSLRPIWRRPDDLHDPKSMRRESGITL